MKRFKSVTEELYGFICDLFSSLVRMHTNQLVAKRSYYSRLLI